MSIITIILGILVALLSSIPARAEDYSASYCLYVVELFTMSTFISLKLQLLQQYGRFI